VPLSALPYQCCSEPERSPVGWGGADFVLVGGFPMAAESVAGNKNVASTVGYEFKMLSFLHEEIKNREEARVGTGTDPADDALLESFLLHTRVLRDFFFARRGTTPRTRTCPKCKEKYETPAPTNDDVFAVDFVPGWAETESNYLKSLNKPLNKLLAHLTLAREEYTLDRYLWEPERIYDELRPVIEKFRGLLTDEQREWFKR
jgi:hypothetical protein